ncbi:hypothetical protein B005_3518 [Nocardiopsis alba ATCC BAA-2165]|uniref:Uncharacterized protein n=1 Tax=Nocardiopsis alba (strain ATCC BAA-2165 / BE74) TaxID=1205910 RepID=J7L569_NOCAA|nr:hypothetical protein B005_3518 [Nocardiopsis alba ATCC BAA-2165]
MPLRRRVRSTGRSAPLAVMATALLSTGIRQGPCTEEHLDQG